MFVTVLNKITLETKKHNAFFQAVDVMMGYGSSVVVENPRELIDEMLIKARGIVDNY